MKVYRNALLNGLVVILLFGCSKVDINGKWNGKLTKTENGITIDAIDFIIKQENKHISGVMTFKNLGGQVKFTGILEGDRLSFDTEFKDGLYVSFVGNAKEKVIKGDANCTFKGPNIGVKHDKLLLELIKQ
jgi:hypothetical protein